METQRFDIDGTEVIVIDGRIKEPISIFTVDSVDGTEMMLDLRATEQFFRNLVMFDFFGDCESLLMALKPGCPEREALEKAMNM